jgi:choline-sulfatase
MSDVGTEPSLISDAAQSSQQPSSASPTPSSDPEAASPLRPSAPPPPNLRATIAEACGLALVSCLLGSIPAGLRVARAGGSFVGGLVVAAAIVLPLLAAAISMSKAAGRGFRMVTGLRVGRSTAAVIALWIGLMAPVLMVLGGLLKEKTNHRGLGGATFGVLGLFVAAGSLAVAYRLVEAARRLVERGLTPRLVAGGLAAVGVVPTVLASIPLLRGHDDSPHAPLVTAALIDGVLFIVAGAVAVTYDVGERARHAARRFGAIAAGAWLVLGALWLSLSPALAAALRTGGGLAAALVGGLERWTDRDGDGHGAHFGGRDCDEGDPRVHPGAQDVSADGVDQDCDGVDGVAVPGARPAAHAQAHVEPTPAAAQDQAPAPAPVAASKPSIVLVTLDTVRADHTSAYGYAQATTPRLASLAAQGALFERAYASGGDSQRALAPLLTGRSLADSPHDKREWPTMSADNDTLAERLKRGGYRTGAVTSFTWLSELRGFSQGVDYWKPVFTEAHPERESTGPLAIKAALNIWKELEADPHPVFLWVHLFDAHERYLEHPGIRFGKGKAALYDGEIAFVDQQLGELYDGIGKSPRAGKVTWIVHGSQGEGLGEHDFTGHGGDLYEEVMRVPLVIAAADGKPGRHTAPVSTLDLGATIIDLAGAEAEGLSGVSLAPIARGELARPHGPVYARSPRRAALIEWPLKLMVIEKKKAADRVLLFDLAKDPAEKEDLASARPDDIERLQKERAKLDAK